MIRKKITGGDNLAPGVDLAPASPRLVKPLFTWAECVIVLRGGAEVWRV